MSWYAIKQRNQTKQRERERERERERGRERVHKYGGAIRSLNCSGNFLFWVVSWHKMCCRYAGIFVLKSWCGCAVGVSLVRILDLKTPIVVLCLSQHQMYYNCSPTDHNVINMFSQYEMQYHRLAVGFQGRILIMTVPWVFRAKFCVWLCRRFSGSNPSNGAKCIFV